MKSQFHAEAERVKGPRDFVFILAGLAGFYFIAYVVFLFFGYFDPPTSPYAPRTDAWLLHLYQPLEWLRHLWH